MVSNGYNRNKNDNNTTNDYLIIITSIISIRNRYGEIIMAAQSGIIHSNVISPTELRVQMRDILLNLPGQFKMPFDVNYVFLYELSKISRLAIIYSNMKNPHIWISNTLVKPNRVGTVSHNPFASKKG